MDNKSGAWSSQASDFSSQIYFGNWRDGFVFTESHEACDIISMFEAPRSDYCRNSLHKRIL